MGISSLEIGKRALAASKVGLDTTSNNIANVNTEGYSRKIVTQSETDPYRSSQGFIGTGVLVDKIRNYREEFFDKEVRATKTRKSGFENDSRLLKRIEAILAEPSDNGLNEMVSNFLNAFEELSQKPEDISLRANLIQIAQSMIDRFNLTAQQFEDLRAEIIQNISNDLDTANRLLKEIANLNNEVQKSIAHDGVGAQTYIDEREKKLEELSKLFEINITQSDFGNINVFVNGMNIITGNIAVNLELKEKVNPTTSEKTLGIIVKGKNKEINIKTNDGEIGTMLTHYNKTLNPLASDEFFSVAKNLDDFVDTLANKINNLVIGGYGLFDKSAPPPARTFFEPNLAKITAANIKLSDDIKSAPEKIPLSSQPNEPGNSEIARKIANLSVDKNFLNNQTPSEFYTNTLGQLGQMSVNAQNGTETSTIVEEQLLNQRESIIGVNLDEEAINLIKYQKSFEAASRVINITSSMLSTLINIGR